MAFEVIKRNKASEMVAEQIIKQISSGKLSPGSQLPSQRELSELLGVGRSSVREAVNALAVIGYLKVQQGKGTFIQIPVPEKDPSFPKLNSALNASSLLYLKEVQVSLECRSAELATERADKKQVQRLKTALEKMKICKDDHQAFILADREFHTILAESTENVVLIEMINLVIISVDNHYAAFDTDRLTAGFINETIRSFEEVLKSIKQKDKAGASNWMNYHINLVLEEFKNIIKS